MLSICNKKSFQVTTYQAPTISQHIAYIVHPTTLWLVLGYLSWSIWSLGFLTVQRESLNPNILIYNQNTTNHSAIYTSNTARTSTPWPLPNFKHVCNSPNTTCYYEQGCITNCHKCWGIEFRCYADDTSFRCHLVSVMVMVDEWKGEFSALYFKNQSLNHDSFQLINNS